MAAIGDELLQPRRRVNSIIYDVIDDAGRLEVRVVHTVNNSQESDRILQSYPDCVIPDIDRHIICCRCKHDFGITISSHTILSNPVLRKVKAGCGPHNTYLAHLEDRICVVAPDGENIDIDRLIAAAKQPKRITKAQKQYFYKDTARAMIVIKHFMGEYNGSEDIMWRVQAALRRLYIR